MKQVFLLFMDNQFDTDTEYIIIDHLMTKLTIDPQLEDKIVLKTREILKAAIEDVETWIVADINLQDMP